MKNFISILAFAAIIASPSFAATTKKTTVKTTTTTSPVTTTSSSPTYSHSSSSTSPVFSANVGFGGINSTFVYGLGLRVDVPMMMDGNSVAFGGETGIYFGSNSVYVIPILVTGKFNIKASSGTLHPYIGLGLGVSIAHAGGGTVSSGGFTVSVPSASSTDFTALIKPGVNFGDHSEWFAELPFGTMAGGFTILPSVGYHFN